MAIVAADGPAAPMPEKVLTEMDGGDSESSPGNTPVAIEALDPVAERKLLLKLDAFFVPIIMAVYLSCFLDRSNIGNVKVAGMPADIGASNEQFSTAVSVFYATYVAFETPWALLLKKLTPRMLLTSLLRCLVHHDHLLRLHHQRRRAVRRAPGSRRSRGRALSFPQLVSDHGIQGVTRLPSGSAISLSAPRCRGPSEDCSPT